MVGQYFTVKPSSSAGVQATAFKTGDKIYIAPDRLLPVQMFIEESKPQPKYVLILWNS
jgi:H/ACA ribonucleoprotein complex subunit 1